MSTGQKSARTKLVNGIDVVALSEIIDAVKQDADVARFRFSVASDWRGADEARTRIKEFYGARENQRTDGPEHVVKCGEPAVLLGKDANPNPVEHLLNALSCCMTTTLAYHAAARGIEIDEISTNVSGDIDLRGFLGVSEDIRQGYQEIEVEMSVKSDGNERTLEELALMSPVYDVVSNSVPVRLELSTR